MTYQEAIDKSFTVKWMVKTCIQGEQCWCRIIEPVDQILYKDGDSYDSYCIVQGGQMSKETAEYFVKLHNDSFNNQAEMKWTSELLECDDCAYSYRSVHPKGLYDLVCPNCGNMAKHNKIYDTQVEEIEEAFREVKRIRDGGIPKRYLQDFNLHPVTEEERDKSDDELNTKEK